MHDELFATWLADLQARADAYGAERVRQARLAEALTVVIEHWMRGI